MVEPELIETIKRRCEKAYPEEACGIITGLPDNPDSDRVVPCENIQELTHNLGQKQHETAGEAYIMDSVQLLEILSVMEKRGEILKAIYHSHPDSEAAFSSADYDRAVHYVDETGHASSAKNMESPHPAVPKPIYTDILHIIVSVNHGRAGKARFFRWNELLLDFTEVG